MHCYLRLQISAAVARKAAAHPAPPCGCSPGGCCGGESGVLPALLLRLALCSPGMPHSLLAISTRSSPGLSFHGGSTRTVPETVHAVPHTRKPLSFPWLSSLRNLFVFLGSLFSLVPNIYVSCNGMPPWIFSNSNAAASILFLSCRRLADFACT